MDGEATTDAVLSSHSFNSKATIDTKIERQSEERIFLTNFVYFKND